MANVIENSYGASSTNSSKLHKPVYVSQSNDYSLESLNDDMVKIRTNLSISNPNRSSYTDNVVPQMFNEFNRWNFVFPDYQLTNTHAKVFFTRPDLNILSSSNSLSSQAAVDPLHLYVFNNQPDVMRHLTKYGSDAHMFNTIISNTAESFEVNDEYVKTIEAGETFTGHRVIYGRNDIESKGSGDLTVKFKDNYNLDIFKTYKIWVDYISKAYRGEFSPKDEYKQAKILDYAVALYYFLLGNDGETIIFWSKYTGVFPTSTSSSTFSWDRDSTLRMPELSIKFSFSFKNDMDPIHLSEFNGLVNHTGSGSIVNAYEPDGLGMGRTWVGPPVVTVTKNARGNTIYKLKYYSN